MMRFLKTVHSCGRRALHREKEKGLLYLIKAEFKYIFDIFQVIGIAKPKNICKDCLHTYVALLLLGSERGYFFLVIAVQSCSGSL
jgi:hypothetical protein